MFEYSVLDSPHIMATPIRLKREGAMSQRPWEVGRKPIPTHPIVSQMLPYLGAVRLPETYAEALLEYIDGKFILDRDGYVSLQESVWIVRETLNEYGIEPVSEEGRFIINGFIEHVKDDLYGDFSQFAYCSECMDEFMIEYSMEYVRKAMANEDILCPDCASP